MEEISFCCSSLAREATSSAAPTTTRRRGKARPANERRRRRQEAWRERKNNSAAAPAASAAMRIAAAPAPAASAAMRIAAAPAARAAMRIAAASDTTRAPGPADMTVATAAEFQLAVTAPANSAVEKVTEAAPIAAAGAVNPGIAAIAMHLATPAVTRAEEGAAATSKTGVARVQKAAPPAKRKKSSAEATRASARASVISRKREASGSLESPEKIRDLRPVDQLNESFKIDLEDPALQREKESDEKETEEKETEEKETAEEKETVEEKEDEEEEKRERKEEAQKPKLQPPPPPPPWSKYFSKNSFRVICVKCFEGNHHVRAPYCVHCDNELGTDVYRNFY